MFKLVATTLGMATVLLSASPAFAETWWTKSSSTEPTILARDKDALDAMYASLVNKDRDAFKDLIQSGDLVVKKPGLQVFIVANEGSVPGNYRYIKVRLKGSSTTYYTTKYDLMSRP